MFTNKNREKMVEKLQTAAVVDVSKALGQEWNSMTDAQKKPFVDASAKDVKRYERETKQFEKHGYFINADGVKSSDVELTTRTFKNHVTLPKKRIRSFAAFVKH